MERGEREGGLDTDMPKDDTRGRYLVKRLVKIPLLVRHELSFCHFGLMPYPVLSAFDS